MTGQLSELFSDQWKGSNERKDITYPIFYMEAVQDHKASKEHGRPVFEEKEYVKIMDTDRLNEFVGPVEERHRQRWPKHYEAFKKGHEMPLEGTPINEWPMISVSQRAELNSLGVRTVEALAEFPDGDIPKRTRLDESKRMAKDWLEEAAKSGLVSSVRQENDKLKKENERLSEQVQKLAARMEVLEEMNNGPANSVASVAAEPPKRKRGRPRKKAS